MAWKHSLISHDLEACLCKNTISQFNQFVLEKKNKKNPPFTFCQSCVHRTYMIYCTPLKKSDICDFHVKFVEN